MNNKCDLTKFKCRIFLTVAHTHTHSHAHARTHMQTTICIYQQSALLATTRKIYIQPNYYSRREWEEWKKEDQIHHNEAAWHKTYSHLCVRECMCDFIIKCSLLYDASDASEKENKNKNDIFVIEFGIFFWSLTHIHFEHLS